MAIFWILLLVCAALLVFWATRARRADVDDPRLAAQAQAEAERRKYDWY